MTIYTIATATRLGNLNAQARPRSGEEGSRWGKGIIPHETTHRGAQELDLNDAQPGTAEKDRRCLIARLRNYHNRRSRVQQIPANPTVRGTSAVCYGPRYSLALCEGQPTANIAELSIRGVARLIGCSAWTVRQKFIPLGLPHLQSGPSGRLTFLSNQGVAWVLAQQQRKGGNRR
jgi:hypothetical protein